MDGLSYRFNDVIKLWVGSKSTWHYVSLPQEMSDEIHTLSQYHQTKRRGWGAVKVDVSVEDQQWQTSIFPAFDNKRYALFLKADVRKRLQLFAGREINVTLTLRF